MTPQAPSKHREPAQTKPQLLVVERMVIARCVRSTPDRMIFRDLLAPDDFTDDARAWIFRQVCQLEDCDQLLARTICERASIGLVRGIEDTRTSFAEDCVSELTYCVETADALDGQTTAAARAYADELRNATIARRIIECSGRALGSMDTVTNWGEWIQKFVGYVSRQADRRLQVAATGPESIEEVAEAFRERLKAPEAAVAARTVGRSGIAAVNRVVGPFERGECYYIAAPPGAGKSAFVLQLARDLSICSRGLVFTMEMSKDRQFDRLVSGVTGIDGRNFKLGTLSEREIHAADRAAQALGGLNMTFKELPSRRHEDMIATIRSEHASKPVDFVMVDYLQLLRLAKPGKSRHEDIAKISNELKALAQQLGICVIGICAINRSAQAEKRPVEMHDLRECGVLEFDAFVIMALEEAKEEADQDDQPQRGFGRRYGHARGNVIRPAAFGVEGPDHYLVNLRFLKQRDGEKGLAIPLHFWPRKTIFSDHMPVQAREA